MISVIIPAKDAADTIESCLRGVLSQRNSEIDYEVILVDDGSTDDTAEIAESLGLRVIRQDNAGPAAARNAGARLAKGDILAFTDADCVPTSNWLLYLTAPFQNPDVVGTKGTYRTQQRSLSARFVQQEYEFKYERMARQASIDFIDTYSAAYRRDVFLKNGGFETAFPAPSVEDQELSFRLARKGYRMVFAPQAVVYHLHDRNLREYLKRKYNIGYWKAVMLRWLPEKAFGDSHTPGSLRWQILLLGLAAVFALLSLMSPGFGWLSLGSLVAFFLTAGPFLSQILRRDKPVLAVALVMLLARSLALGSGLLAGFLFPAARRPTPAKGLSPSVLFIKRTADIVGGCVGILLSLPIIALAALAIKLDSSGPVLLVQERVGENGTPFKVFKLRTMVEDAGKQVQDILQNNPLKGPVYKIPDDPRITRVGRVLRRWSLDELTQFWNVLHGEMSLVGPRPEETWVVAQYDDRQRQRLAVKPGLTGPMQISGRGALDMDERLSLELEYIRNYSIKKDVIILIKTLPAIIGGQGAF